VYGIGPAAPRRVLEGVHVNRPPELSDDLKAAGVVALGLGVVAAFAALDRALPHRGRPARPLLDRSSRLEATRAGETPAVRGPARQLYASAALLSAAVLADSGMEHYGANFENPAMYTPLVSSSLSILANLQGLAFGGRFKPFRKAVNGLARTVGVVGLGFHAFNILKRPGRLSWLNLFYAAPFGAPAALTLAGVIGDAAEQASESARGKRRLFGLPFGRAMAGVAGVGLAGSAAEAALFHWRGAFQNPFMWLPVSLPPVAAALTARAAVAPAKGPIPLTRGWLWTTALLGVAGVGFHAYGIARSMGGWKNWSQNLLAGPPLPAPPAFSALALAAIAALDLIETERG
jgi:hypothetical protein